MAELAEKIVGAGLGFKAAKDQAKAAREAAERRMNLIKSLDFNPAYTSELAPTFKRTESPVARGWIESFLMGNNPNAINPISPNADKRKAAAQLQQNAMFGTPQARVMRQRQIEQEQPWKVGVPGAPGGAVPGAAPGTAGAKRTLGATPKEAADAELFNTYNKPEQARSSGLTSDLDAAMKAANPKWKDKPTAIIAPDLIKKFGSAEAAAEALRRGDKEALKIVSKIPFGY